MYFWNVDLLVEDFKSESVSQKEELKYMLLFTIAMALGSDPILTVGSSYNYYDTICSIAILAISVFGICHCYKINSRGDDKDFIVRMMCLGLPVVIRALAVMIPVFIIGGFIETAFLYPESLETETYESTPVQVALISTFIAGYYWYLSTKIKLVSSSNA